MDYIICSICECLFGGSNGLSALVNGWVWRNNKWVCPKCKKEEDGKN